MKQSIHPSVNGGPGRKKMPASNIWKYLSNKPKPGGTLRCRCQKDKVEVRVSGPAAHNHLCGCTRCWRPEGALFSQVAVVPRDRLEVTRHPEKLRVVDQSAAIKRHACIECGAHMFGRVEDPDHHFFGLDFIHVELSNDAGWPPPQFAGFVSSLTGTGVAASELDDIRARLRELGLEPYDEFSPELNSFIASRAAKLNYKNQVF